MKSNWVVKALIPLLMKLIMMIRPQSILRKKNILQPYHHYQKFHQLQEALAFDFTSFLSCPSVLAVTFLHQGRFG